MLFTLKFLHLIGLMLGAAAGFGTMAVVRQQRRGGPAPALAALRPFFGSMGMAGILLLWATGLLLWLVRYDMVDLGPAWHAKLGVAALLLIIICVTFAAVRRALAAGEAPPAWVRAAGMTTPVLTLLAVGLASWVFL